MKLKLLTFVVLIFPFFINGQAPLLKLKGGDIKTQPNIQSFKVSDFTAEAGSNYVLLLQFQRIPSQTSKEMLEKQGVDFHQYIPDNTYLVSIPASTLDKRNLLEQAGAIYVGEMPQEAKIHPSVSLNSSLYPDLEIYFYDFIDKKEKIRTLQSLGFDITQERNDILFKNFNENEIKNLAKQAAIKYIAPRYIPELVVDEDIVNARAAAIKSTTTLGLTGNGVVVGVGDGGTVESHFDLNTRILNSDNAPVNGHGALVTGIIAGDGTINPVYEGFAPSAEVVNDYFDNVLVNTPSYYTTYGMTLTNNSYRGGYTSFCAEVGIYDAISEYIDNQMLTQSEVLHIFAAGNDGGITCSPLPTGYGTIPYAYQATKNALVVGSVSDADVISSFSSRGPVKDGRLKPEVVAVGESVAGTNTLNNYYTSSGTSFSSPSVTGLAALLSEHYQSTNGGSNPQSDLLKPIIANSADDLGNAGPDYIYGFGRVNGRRAANIITNATYFTGNLSNGGAASHIINVPAGTNELKVMLYWHDAAASPSSNPALVNNLDLTVEDPASTSYNPWILDPANPATTAIRGVDNLNNIEQFTIDNPSSGTWTVNVDATLIPAGSQNYTIVYEVLGDELVLTSPLGGEVFNQGQGVLITWDQLGYGTSDFTLEYSDDAGATWSTITASASGTFFNWTTPSINSDQVRVRITDNATSTSDESANFTIADVPGGLALTADCNGTMTLSWSALAGATSYDVMRTDPVTEDMQFLANTTSTSYIDNTATGGETYFYSVVAVFGTTKSRYPEAVGAKAGNGLIASFPYLEGFEAGAGGFYSDGKNNSWQLGTPTGTLLNRAAEGSNAWATNLSGNYNDGERSYLYSPCYDLTSLTNPVLAFGFAFDIEDNETTPASLYDYAQVFYSTDGETWLRLGNNGDAHNWYNNAGGANVFDGTKSHWHSVSYELPALAKTSSTRFRFLLNSDPFTTQEGLAIDNIHIYDAQTIFTGSTTAVTQSVSGSNWIDFISGGGYVASINPNGQNLGSTTVDVYINAGAIRTANDQYYPNRNWRIQPTTQPTSPVSVRLYITDTEIEDTRAATGCGTCTTLIDAFVTGLTKYSNDDGTEDGTLDNNNLEGELVFLIPSTVSVEPFDDGYYLEFQVSSFSEFYPNGGGPDATEPLPVELLYFDAIKQESDALLTWATASEINFDKFEVQVAVGDEALRQGDFTLLGTVAQKGAESGATYSFLDDEKNKSGARYYRLKIIDLDGTFEYSPIEVLAFDKLGNFAVQPNPISGNEISIISSEFEGEASVRLLNGMGQMIFQREINLNEGQNVLPVQEQLSPATYWLEIRTAQGIHTQKIVVQP